MLKGLIQEHITTHMKIGELYNEYKGNVAIKKRRLADPLKANNQLANDYRGQIIDSIVGYMFGNPISYSINKQSYEGRSDYDINSDLLQDFILRNSLDDLDSEAGKLSTICGYTGRLLYIDTSGDERVVNVPPWECIFVEHGSTNEPQLGIRYYKVETEEGQETRERYKVEVYDNTYLTVYLQNNAGNYDMLESPKPHLFNGIPLIKIINNEELMGDFEKVQSLIDAYDLMLSDAQNEIEEFRNAYMTFTGAEVDAEFMNAAKQSGAIQLPEGASAAFLTKQINDVFLQNQKETLNENIYKFAQAVDYASEGFANVSGESRKWKLLSLENRAITKERKFSKALKQMFKVVCSAWQTKGYDIDYLDIFWEFSRNLPVDLQHYTDVASKLRGHVSETTRLGLLPFVDDVEWEKEEMANDAAKMYGNVNFNEEVEEEEEDNLLEDKAVNSEDEE